MEETFKVGGALPDEAPDPTRLIHDDVVNLARAKVLVRRRRHLEILAEEHDLEGGVRKMAHLDHLEAKVLPGGVNGASNEWHKETQAKHVHRSCRILIFFGSQPADHLVGHPGHYDVIGLQEHAHDEKLYELGLVDFDDSLHEGEAIGGILLDVFLYRNLKLLLFSRDGEAFR